MGWMTVDSKGDEAESLRSLRLTACTALVSSLIATMISGDRLKFLDINGSGL